LIASGGLSHLLLERHVISTGTSTAVDFVVPGILSLAIMSTAMVSLGIRHRLSSGATAS